MIRADRRARPCAAPTPDSRGRSNAALPPALPYALPLIHRHPAARAGATLACALSALAAASAAAVGIGQVTQQSALGQSLRVVVPVLLTADEDIAAECFKLATSNQDADGIPQLAFGRVSFERTSSGAQLVVTNARPVSEPILRLTLQAGCNTAVRREFVLFMDPPSIEAPRVAEDSAIGNDAAPPAPPTPRPLPAARGSARVAANATRDNARAGTRAAGESARETRKPTAPKPRAIAKAAPKRPAPTVAMQPRLTLSSASLPPIANANAKGIAETRQAQTQQELANAIEAETVVLRQRIIELSAMIEKMQQEVRAGEIAQRGTAEAPRNAPAADTASTAAPATASGETPKPAPVPSASGGWRANWPLFAAIVGLPLILAAALLWKRRRDVRRIADWGAASTATNRPETTSAAPVAPALRNPPAGVANPGVELEIAPPLPKKTPRQAPVARDGANALAVSELLHVTDESRVYVALGHPDRAIEVLSEHIRQAPRPMPAAWLMLLDLYHASGLRQEFRRLAEEFHVQCNVQTPLWEGFGSNELDDGGIETFPHVLRRIVELWRTPECLDYLERLLHDNRETRRTGFPLAAYSDILMLMQILDAPDVVDIDTDLANEGKLDPLPQRAAAAAAAKKRGGSPRAPDRAAAPPAAPTDQAVIARPSQQPLEFELDLNDEARNRGNESKV